MLVTVGPKSVMALFWLIQNGGQEEVRNHGLMNEGFSSGAIGEKKSPRLCALRSQRIGAIERRALTAPSPMAAPNRLARRSATLSRGV